MNINIHVNRDVYLVQTLYEHTCTGFENSKQQINIIIPAKRKSIFWRYKPCIFKQGTHFIPRVMQYKCNSCMNMQNIHFLQQKGSGFQNDLRYNGYFCMQRILLFERKRKRGIERDSLRASLKIFHIQSI